MENTNFLKIIYLMKFLLHILLIALFLSMINGEFPLKTSDGDAMKIDITVFPI